MHQFERTAKMAFQRRDPLHFGWIYQLYILLRSLVTGSMYPTRMLESLLQEAYGSEKILDCSTASAMGIDIGVTVTSMKPEPFLLTNYNGVGDREDRKQEYGVLLGNVPVWEMYVCPWLCGGTNVIQCKSCICGAWVGRHLTSARTPLTFSVSSPQKPLPAWASFRTGA